MLQIDKSYLLLLIIGGGASFKNRRKSQCLYNAAYISMIAALADNLFDDLALLPAFFPTCFLFLEERGALRNYRLLLHIERVK